MYGLRALSRLFDRDLTGLNLDAPFPNLAPDEQVQGSQSRTAPSTSSTVTRISTSVKYSPSSAVDAGTERSLALPSSSPTN